MLTSLSATTRPCIIFNSSVEPSRSIDQGNLPSNIVRVALSSEKKDSTCGRRYAMSCCGVSMLTLCTVNSWLMAKPAWAGNGEKDQDDDGIVGAVKSLFDPNEVTKSGKVLPKDYLKSAREVVRTLQESFKEDPKDNSKFRRTADSAKESIREYINTWRGRQEVTKEESYVMIEKAIRSLAKFYSKAGPSAPLPEDVKSEILKDLNMAEEFL
ncbi:photosystem II D1 precursor processing protein PSB27-H2, chloroplastic isoform X2 [Impatiens glandulifera]|uniref:photosystem II D1 precursor processing protein PSB27-H2, chloroplastic isoform X2 n=1 Tax=Impatiens glandulifera TaxID=253017 RepID=UPI001FB0CAEE|nr:photosystem II D1 precursor processing protein PSB27-H2, chloroplastic isoform X2 [Impatiens glandulifera]